MRVWSGEKTIPPVQLMYLFFSIFFFKDTSRYMYFTLRVQMRRSLALPRRAALAAVAQVCSAAEITDKGVSVDVGQ